MVLLLLLLVWGDRVSHRAPPGDGQCRAETKDRRAWVPRVGVEWGGVGGNAAVDCKAPWAGPPEPGPMDPMDLMVWRWCPGWWGARRGMLRVPPLAALSLAPTRSPASRVGCRGAPHSHLPGPRGSLRGSQPCPVPQAVVGDSQYHHFRHRVPPASVRQLEVAGDVELTSVCVF